MNRPDYLPDYLTKPQVEAITHRGSPLLIIGGPGSGKTEVITWRAAYLVWAGYVRPQNLLAITFTNKAALELKDRLQPRLPQVNVELMPVSTIHSFCADLLHRYQQHLAMPHGFRILDPTTQFLFVYTNRTALGLDNLVKGHPYDFFTSVIRTFNLATAELVEVDRFESFCQENLAHCSPKEADLWRERTVVAEAYRHYCALLRAQRLIDFAFLQRHALTLLENNPGVLAELQAQYREILVDEYQDATATQARLLALLAGDSHNLTVAGDDDQSIYRCRGATVQNVYNFSNRFPGARKIELSHNFRSREAIVTHSQRVIARNPARIPKTLLTMRGTGSDILLVYRRTAAEEATAIADLLRRLHEAGQIPRYSDVAILLRHVRSQAGPYLEALRAAGIPYHLSGEASFFERTEIAQLYDLFHFLGTAESWGDRFLRRPLVGLSRTTCQALQAYKKNLLDVASEAGLQAIGVADEIDRRRLLALLNLKQQVQAKARRSLLDVFYNLLAVTGCVARFEWQNNFEALANLGVLSRVVAAWDEYGSTGNFYAFQEYLRLLKEGGLEPITVPAADAVQVLSIHQAKGQEFPVVVLGAAMNGRLPGLPGPDRYRVPHTLRASGSPEVNDPHLVDERKLFYVAASRARELLIIGTADVVNKRGGGPSLFLYEMFGGDLSAATDMTRAYVEAVESHPVRPPASRQRYRLSQLAYFLQCPMRYKFAVIYGLQVPWLDPVDFGANIHRALEAIHRHALAGHVLTEEELEAVVAEIWVPGRRVRPEYEAAYQAAAVNQLRRYLREHGDCLADVLQAETNFSISLAQQVLVGKIDLLRRQEDGCIEVVDFKSSAVTPVAVEKFDLQLDLYAMGTEASLGHCVARQTAHFLKDGQVSSWEWSPERELIARARLNGLLSQIARHEFPPRSSYCSRCQEFQAVCPYYATETPDEKT